MKTCLIAVCCLLFSWIAVAAQDSSAGKPTPIIRTNGEKAVMIKPDRAQIDLGVVTQGATSQETVEQNSRQLDAVIAALRKLLGATADIKTVNYGLTPRYRYAPPTEPTITGYTAVNIVRVVVTDLDLLGKVIDAAGAAGANQIQSLQFTVGNQQAAQAQALNEAAVTARGKAEQLASAMGVKIIRILSITDTTPPAAGQYIQFFAGHRDGNANATAPGITSPAIVAPQTVEVRATVTLTVEISQ